MLIHLTIAENQADPQLDETDLSNLSKFISEQIKED